MRRLQTLPTITILIIGVCLAVSAFWGKDVGRGTERLESSVYVWQRAWSASVRNAVREAGPHVDSFMVLAGELGSGEVRPDWETIAAVERPVTLVFRVPERFGKEMQGEQLGPFVEKIVNAFAALTASAEAYDARIAGIQLDFDCPTSKLDRYGRFLAAFRTELPDTTLSFTALPTWLGSETFKRVAQNTDYFVLQVHALEVPASSDLPLHLCDVSKLDAYFDSASAVGVPYYVALPTYGYRVAFNSEGIFAGLSAEGPVPAWPSDYIVRELRADAAEMADVVRDIQAASRPHCLGLTWFRLPIKEDTMNWSWPTLHAVMQGQAPTLTYRAELRTPESGLTEVWLTHDGDAGNGHPVQIPVDLSGAHVTAWDVLNGFKRVSAGGNIVALTGRPPRDQTPMMIAWFRVESGQQSIAIQTHQVETPQ